MKKYFFLFIVLLSYPLSKAVAQDPKTKNAHAKGKATMVNTLKSSNKPPNIRWQMPFSDNEKVTQNEYQIEACIESESEVQSVRFLLNGEEKNDRGTGVKPKIRNKCTHYVISPKIYLRQGNNTLRIEVQTASGSNSVERTIFLEDYSTPSERRLALVIGNSNYQKKGGYLANALNDAKSIKKALETLGFKVLYYEDLSNDRLKQAIDDFGVQLKDYKQGLFYYAGHGIQIDSKNYLVPIDAKNETVQQVEFHCVEASRVLKQMQHLNPSIMILDACRDNPFERAWNRTEKGKGLAYMSAPNSFIAYATAPNQTAKDENSYTTVLIKYLTEPGLDLNEVFDKTMEEVKINTKQEQIPHISKTYGKKFYFKK